MFLHKQLCFLILVKRRQQNGGEELGEPGRVGLGQECHRYAAISGRGAAGEQHVPLVGAAAATARACASMAIQLLYQIGVAAEREEARPLPPSCPKHTKVGSRKLSMLALGNPLEFR